MSPFTAKVVGAVSSAPKRTLLAAVAHACWASVSQAGSGPAAVASGGGFGGPAPAVGSIQWLLEVNGKGRKQKQRKSLIRLSENFIFVNMCRKKMHDGVRKYLVYRFEPPFPVFFSISISPLSSLHVSRISSFSLCLALTCFCLLN